jgi:hypothetical protein
MVFGVPPNNIVHVYINEAEYSGEKECIVYLK